MCEEGSGTQTSEDEPRREHEDTSAQAEQKLEQQEKQTDHSCSPDRFRSPVEYFTGRDTILQHLGEVIRSQPGAVVVLAGPDGVGKTELAYALAQHLVSAFPDDHIAIELGAYEGCTLSPAHALQRVIHTFEPQAQLSDHLDRLRERYQNILRQHRCIILAEDAVDVAQVECLTPPPGSALIITTTHLLEIPNASLVILGPLESPAAQHLIRSRCSQMGEEEIAALSALTQNMPLLLAITTGILALCPPETVRAHLAELTRQLQAQQEPGKGSTEHVSPAAVLLDWAIEQLPPEAQTALAHLSVFPTSFDREAAKAVVNLREAQKTGKQQTGSRSRGRATPLSLEQILHTLSQCSFLSSDAETNRYVMHPTLQRIGLRRIGDQLRGVALRHARYYARVAEEVERLYQMGDEHLFAGLRLFDRERRNIEVGWHRARTYGEDDLLLRYAVLLGFTGMLRYPMRSEYLSRAQEALAVAERLRRREHEAHALNDLGYAYSILGELQQAVDLFTRALRILRTSPNLQRKVKKEGSIMSHLSLAYLRMGNVQKAMEQSKLRLELALASKDWRGEGIALNNLGLAAMDLGKTTQAIAYFQKSLQLSRKYGDLNSEATDLGNLGRAYVETGELEQAIALCQQALDTKWELGNSRDESYAHHFLGVAHAAAGDLDAARAHQDQALALASEVGDRWLEGRITQSLGEIALAAGDLPTAYARFTQALDIAQTIGDQRGIALARWHLGLTLQQQGGDTAQIIEQLQARVAYERSIGHAEAEIHAEMVARIGEQLGITVSG